MYERESRLKSGSTFHALRQVGTEEHKDKDKDKDKDLKPATVHRHPLSTGARARSDIPHSADSLLYMQQMFGNQYVQRLVQRKLAVSSPGDASEREADHVADRIVNMSDAAALEPQRVAAVQPITVSPSEKPPGRATELARDAVDANGVHANAETAVSAASMSPGHPLPPNVQAKFEHALGADLSGVRVHTGSQSIDAARSISARAYTTGADIHFNQGEYDPHSAAGQRLLAHEVAHTVQQGSSPVADRKLMRDTSPPGTAPANTTTAGQPAPVAAPTTVETLWNINFIDQFAGTGEKVAGRSETTSLYVKELKVAPEGDQGKKPPAPKVFKGATLAQTGRAELGGFTHPKDKGGKVSGSVAYGDMPTFSFTLKTPGYDPKTAGKEEKDEAIKARRLNAASEQKDIVKELTAALDTFYDEDTAQTKLQEIVNSHFEHLEVEATLKLVRKERTKPINVQDFSYGPLSADKTFNLMVTIPNVTKDKSTSWTQQKGKEKTQGEEHVKEEGKETGKVQKTAVETEFIKSFESAFMSELSAASEKVAKTANLNENSTTHTGQMSVKNSTAAKLSGDISGKAGLDLSSIPLAGKILGKLLNAEVNIDLKPDLSDTFELTHVSTDEEAKKTVVSQEDTVRTQLASKMTESVKNAWSSKLRTQVETQTHETTTQKTTDKQSGGGKENESTSATSTQGTVTIVANAVQPVLVEE